MNKKLRVSPSPHIRTKETVENVMWDVVIALTPAILAAIYFFRLGAVKVLSVSIITAVVSEAIAQKLMGRKIQIKDGSAIITGILFAFVVPPTLPWWITMIGAGVSIILGKMVFGGLGHNVFNPALIGRAFLLASWPVAMTSWIGVDGKAGPTILGVLKEHGFSKVLDMFGNQGAMYTKLFLGNVGGSLGETSVLALLIGAGYLLYKKQITWHTPVVYIGTVFVLMWIFGQDPLMEIMSGGLILGAFFMATDMVTTPYTSKGKILFGLGAGILVVWIRLKGGYPEGVAYSILLMNGVTPLINMYTRPRIFGGVKNNG
ncbi:RnfABCDGE type electron transport complex subunit D [Haliovirga abyssi]|uniref:Ion-translocating oxidoreductase complex subunit D n=1 Tax=Haliovirga abyssi TaxID=2996794 RepID=A0AAU9DUM7_9FUSO|nr:RnfABCDGE type electron transport complex subunit D [Haliovirga abyssi]BDU49696.1 electron transport complex subunit D [Haliovirga abyssi]